MCIIRYVYFPVNGLSLLFILMIFVVHCNRLQLLSSLLRTPTFQALPFTLCNLSANHNNGPENQKEVSQVVLCMI